jgi:hypothetical protein
MFSIKNWTRFQHYKQRHPPWIKMYHDLLDDEAFGELDLFAQLLYLKLLLAASRKDNRIPEDTAWMATELSLPRQKLKQGVQTLLDTGFLASDSASKSASKVASKNASADASAAASKSASTTRAPARSRETEAEIDTVPNGTALALVPSVAGGQAPDAGLPAVCAGLVAAPASPAASSQTLVAEFVDDARSRRVEVPRRVVGQVAQSVKSLLDEGIDPVRVRAGLVQMLDRGKVIPSSLPNFVMEAGLPAANGKRYGRGNSAAQIIAGTRGLA